VVGCREGRVEVGVDAVGAGEGGPGVDERVLVLGLRRVVLAAPGLVQLAQLDERTGEREAGDDVLQPLDGLGLLTGRRLGAGAPLQRRARA
jgi:hypothetical protein